MSKKGVLGLAIVNVYSIILLVTILVIFGILFWSISFAGREEVLTSEELNYVNLVTLNYLRSNFSLDGKDINMADLIVLFSKDKSYEEFFEKKTEEILGEVYSICYKVYINDYKTSYSNLDSPISSELLIIGYDKEVVNFKLEVSRKLACIKTPALGSL